MAEGSVIVDGRLSQLYESGAAAYLRHRWPHHVHQLLDGRVQPRDRLSVHPVGGEVGGP